MPFRPRCRYNSQLTTIKRELKGYKAKMADQQKTILDYATRLDENDKKNEEMSRKYSTLLQVMNKASRIVVARISSVCLKKFLNVSSSDYLTWYRPYEVMQPVVHLFSDNILQHLYCSGLEMFLWHSIIMKPNDVLGNQLIIKKIPKIS